MQKVYFKQAMDGCYRALIELREQGAVKAIGVGVNDWEVMLDFMKAGDFDTLLVAGRYTLLEQEALNELLPLCERRNTALVIGGGFNGGILATGAVPGAKWNYAPAPAPVMDKVRRIEAVCARHKVLHGGGGAAVPPRPSRRCLAYSGYAQRGADGTEHRSRQPSDPQRFLAGAETRRPSPPGCARSSMSRKIPAAAARSRDPDATRARILAAGPQS